MIEQILQNVLVSLYRTFIEKDRYMAFVKGLGVTLEISFFAVLLGTAIGIIVAVVKFSAKRSKWMWLPEKICNAYVGIIRGTPVYVQLLISACLLALGALMILGCCCC